MNFDNVDVVFHSRRVRRRTAPPVDQPDTMASPADLTSDRKITAGEADAWLAQISEGNDIEPPECHG